MDMQHKDKKKYPASIFKNNIVRTHDIFTFII